MPNAELLPEFLELPPGANGLPDILVLAKTLTHGHGIVRAFIIPSDPASKGYWAERYNADGDDPVKWCTLYAKTMARQYYFTHHAKPQPGGLAHFSLNAIADWDAFSVQRRLGFYPTMDVAAGTAHDIFTFLQDAEPNYYVTVTPQHFQRQQ